MIDRLAVIVPTRGRVEACRELIATFDETCGEDTHTQSWLSVTGCRCF